MNLLRARLLFWIAERRTRSWLALVGIPLALIAVSLSDLWWTWLPLSVLAWWWSPREWPYTWLLPIEAGAVGAQWAILGAVSLAKFPNHRLLVCVCWIELALGFAAVSARSRRRHREL